MIIYIKKIPFYVSCLFKVTKVLKNPFLIVLPLFHIEVRFDFKNGSSLTVNEPMQILLIAETLIDDVYGIDEIGGKGGIFIDIGAAIGDLSSKFAFFHPEGQVVAVEPSVRTFRLLQKNVSDNKLGNVLLLNNAVGTQEKYVLNLSNVIGCDTISEEKNMYSKQNASEVIDGITLSNVLSKVGRENESISMVKIDCEGAELDIINSLEEKGYARIERFAIEYHNHITPNEDQIIKDILEKRGFEVRLLPDNLYDFFGYLFASKT